MYFCRVVVSGDFAYVPGKGNKDGKKVNCVRFRRRRLLLRILFIKAKRLVEMICKKKPDRYLLSPKANGLCLIMKRCTVRMS